MAEVLSTNVCCLDLTQKCVDYLKGLGLNVYEGSLGSVFHVDWNNINRSHLNIFGDINYPENLHEYHVFVADTINAKQRNYNDKEHEAKEIARADNRCLVCKKPVSVLDLRPLGTYRLEKAFQAVSFLRRIEVVFVGPFNKVEYTSSYISYYDPQRVGELNNLSAWGLAHADGKVGKRTKLADTWISRCLFEGRRNALYYHHTFSLPTKWEGDEKVADERYFSILDNEDGECISYIYAPDKDFISVILPDVKDRVGVLKALFEYVLFPIYSDYFPDIEAKRWIHKDEYAVPAELVIREKIEAKRKEYEAEISSLEDESKRVREQYTFLKDLLTATGSELVQAVKKYLEWLGFESVEDKDETLTEGEFKEEDLNLSYDGNLVLIEVKGISGTSTDAECSQVDKIVQRRIKKLRTPDVHGVYVVNHRKNVEPLKRPIPPFNAQQIDDAKAQDRTLVYTMQLFSLYSDIENGYITKEEVRECFMKPGLADFHSVLTSLGIPYSYFQNDTVVCVELNDTQVSVGDILYYKDELNRLVGCKVVGIQQDKHALETTSSGKIGIKVEPQVPRNRVLWLR